MPTDNQFIEILTDMLIEKASMSEDDAYAQAVKVYNLRTKLLSSTEPVHFSYLKKDGTIRHATGTANKELIPVEASSSTSSNGKFIYSPMQIRYYDNDAGAWRSFLAQNLI